MSQRAAQHSRGIDRPLLVPLEGEALDGYRLASTPRAARPGPLGGGAGLVCPALHPLERGGLLAGEWRVGPMAGASTGSPPRAWPPCPGAADLFWETVLEPLLLAVPLSVGPVPLWPGATSIGLVVGFGLALITGNIVWAVGLGNGASGAVALCTPGGAQAAITGTVLVRATAGARAARGLAGEAPWRSTRRRAPARRFWASPPRPSVRCRCY